MVWKNTMATDQTDGEPPSRGSTMRVNIGCTANSSSALVNTAAVNTARTRARRRPWTRVCCGAEWFRFMPILEPRVWEKRRELEHSAWRRATRLAAGGRTPAR